MAIAAAGLVACGEVKGESTIDAPTSAGATCTDGKKNGSETDVDCGGPECGTCAAAKGCSGAPDCESGVCTNQACQVAACTDGVRNSDELDVDCAGHCGARSCSAGQTCSAPADCESNVCTSNACVAAKRVFVSSTIYSGGQIGNAAGGDTKCQSLAQAAGLTGTYKAWLSTTAADATTRLTHATIPYILVDGTQVAASFTDLTDGTLANPINKTEAGGVPPASEAICDANTDWVHTGTREDGTLYDPNATCTNFTVDTGGGGFGRFGVVSGSWTLQCGGGAPVNYCGKRAHIYCFEQ